MTQQLQCKDVQPPLYSQFDEVVHCHGRCARHKYHSISSKGDVERNIVPGCLTATVDGEGEDRDSVVEGLSSQL